MFGIVKSRVDRWLPGARDQEEWGVTASGPEVSLGDDETVLELDVIVVQRCDYTKTTKLYPLKRYILWYVKCISIKKNSLSQTLPRPINSKSLWLRPRH